MLRPRQAQSLANSGGSGSSSPSGSGVELDTPFSHYGPSGRPHASASHENLESSPNDSPSSSPVDYFPNGLSGAENVRASGADLQSNQPLRRGSGGASKGGKDGIKPLTGSSNAQDVAQRRGQRSMSISLSDIGAGVGKGKRKANRLGKLHIYLEDRTHTSRLEPTRLARHHSRPGLDHPDQIPLPSV